MEKSTRIVIAFVIVAVMSLIAYSVWEKQRDKKIVSSVSVGIAQTARFFPLVIRGASTTQITTDKGMFLVNGSFQLIKGDELFIEKRASGRSYVCDYKIGECNVLE